MALSNEQPDLQSTDYLPAREVMSGMGGGHGHGGCFLFQHGLVNVNVQDVDIIDDVNILTGKDSDVVDIDDTLNYIDIL